MTSLELSDFFVVWMIGAGLYVAVLLSVWSRLKSSRPDRVRLTAHKPLAKPALVYTNSAGLRPLEKHRPRSAWLA